MKTEIKALISARNEVAFKELDAQWQPQKADENIQNFITDAEVDIIVTLGFLSSQAATQLPSYPKPIIAATILDRTFQNLPLQPQNNTGISNFSFIESWVRIKEDMIAFSEMFQFNHLAIVIPRSLLDEFNEIDQFLTDDRLDFSVSFVSAEANSNPFSQLPEDVDAVMVFPLVLYSS